MSLLHAHKKVTTDLIEEYLDRYGWKAHRSVEEESEQEGVVVTGWRSPADNEFRLLIDPMVEKHALRFRVLDVASAPMDETPADGLLGLLLVMSHLNDRYVMGAFTYLPSTGEVSLQLGLPIDSDDLRYEDFEHCVRMLTKMTDERVADLRAIISGAKKAQDVIATL